MSVKLSGTETAHRCKVEMKVSLLYRQDQAFSKILKIMHLYKF